MASTAVGYLQMKLFARVARFQANRRLVSPLSSGTKRGHLNSHVVYNCFARELFQTTPAIKIQTIIRLHHVSAFCASADSLISLPS